jgi:hypothetical protein
MGKVFWLEWPEGRRHFDRPWLRGKDNFKMGLIEIGFGIMNWIWLPQDRDHWWASVSMVTNLWVP